LVGNRRRQRQDDPRTVLIDRIDLRPAPVIEETLFRGYLFRAMSVRYGLRWAYPISATLFAAFHGTLPLIVPLAIAGLLYAWAYQRTGNLLANITAHATSNALALALTLLFS